jgi:DNA-binding MarR family transcriptional regulator
MRGLFTLVTRMLPWVQVIVADRSLRRPGRRGNTLALTPAGEQHLASAAQAIRSRLAEWLSDWKDQDIATFAELVARFNVGRNQT